MWLLAIPHVGVVAGKIFNFKVAGKTNGFILFYFFFIKRPLFYFDTPVHFDFLCLPCFLNVLLMQHLPATEHRLEILHTNVIIGDTNWGFLQSVHIALSVGSCRRICFCIIFTFSLLFSIVLKCSDWSVWVKKKVVLTWGSVLLCHSIK